MFLSKACIGIDLKSEAGRELASRLIAKADVVSSNFTPHVMEQFGLGPEELRARHPKLIVLQLSGYGVPGPWQDFPAYGPSVEAAGGMNRLMGRESDPPVRVGSGVFADQLSGRYAALALVAALKRRRETGQGQYIDVSMYESISHILGQFMLSAARSGGSLPPRIGNRDPDMAPQGIYPCAGDDEWVAISVRDDREWQALKAVVGDERLDAPAYDTFAGRVNGHDTIDEAIALWTRGRAKLEAAEQLQAHGVAAGPVQKVSDIPFDSHLRERGFLQDVEHQQPLLGYAAHPHLTTPWVVEGRDRAELTDIHFAGADNVRVLASWLGAGDEEIEALTAAGAIFSLQVAELQDRAPVGGASTDHDFGQRLGLPAVAGWAAEDAGR